MVPSDIVYPYKFIKSSSSSGVIGVDIGKVKSDWLKSKINRSKSIKPSPKYGVTLSLNFKGFNLPDTMDYSKWGTIIFQSDLFAEVKKLSSKFSYHINILEKSLLVTLKYKDKVILEFTDEQIEKGKLNSFIRKIKNRAPPLALFGLKPTRAKVARLREKGNLSCLQLPLLVVAVGWKPTQEEQRLQGYEKRVA